MGNNFYRNVVYILWFGGNLQSLGAIQQPLNVKELRVNFVIFFLKSMNSLRLG